jgi:sulfonate transport system permease protein
MQLSTRFRDQILPFVLPASLILLWQIGCSTGVISDRLLPAPIDIVAAAVRLTVSGELPQNIEASALRACTGLIAGGAIGFALGLANGLSVTAERITDTSMQMLRNIPNLALIPLVILWFGIGEGAKFFLVALGVLFPIYINTFQGVRTVDPQLLEMGRIYGMSPLTLFRKVILPGALPSIFVGLRYALGIMWLTLIVAETIAASSGLGHMAMEAREFMAIDIVVLAILIYALLGKLADVATRWMERRMLAWHPAYQTV